MFIFLQGFEILFGIIRSEGGTSDAGIVVQDCLQICANILQGSEICQRFFFGMGIQWLLELHTFFDPKIIENFASRNNSRDHDHDDAQEGAWFNQKSRVCCAALALKSLCGALEVVNQKHQLLVALKTDVACSAAFWLARKGPASIVEEALVLLSCILENNPQAANHVSNMMVEVSPAVSGTTHPVGVDMPSVYFGWRPLPSDDRRFITVPALLAERYVFSSTVWGAASTSVSASGPVVGVTAEEESKVGSVCGQDGLSIRCLDVLETLLKADSTICDLMIQFILAPPPPSAADEDYANGDASALEGMRWVLQ